MVAVATLQQRRGRGRCDLLLVPLQVMRQPGAAVWGQELPGSHHRSLQLLQVEKRQITHSLQMKTTIMTTVVT